MQLGTFDTSENFPLRPEGAVLFLQQAEGRIFYKRNDSGTFFPMQRYDW